MAATEEKPARILIIDDDPVVASALGRLLRRYRVVTMVDSQEALAHLLGGEIYDVVVCDLMMPLLSGAALHDRLMTARPEQAKRMIFVTGGAFSLETTSFLERVVQPVLAKPVTRADLLVHVERILGTPSAG